MMFVGVFPHYLLWHYTIAPIMGTRLCRNLFFAIGRIFPIRNLLRNLFAPWHRVQEPTSTKKFDVEAWAGRVVVNIMSRLIGALARLTVIAVGLSSYGVSLFGITTLYLVWFMAPVIIMGMFALGIEALL